MRDDIPLLGDLLSMLPFRVMKRGCGLNLTRVIIKDQVKNKLKARLDFFQLVRLLMDCRDYYPDPRSIIKGNFSRRSLLCGLT